MKIADSITVWFVFMSILLMASGGLPIRHTTRCKRSGQEASQRLLATTG